LVKLLKFYVIRIDVGVTLLVLTCGTLCCDRLQ